MNTAERIVEAYFRHCRGCFTIPDVKVINGNNRQFDLLACNLTNGLIYHVETSVVPSGRYFPNRLPDLLSVFQKKFFGLPEDRQNVDYIPSEDDRDYQKVIQTYAAYGLNPALIVRVWCSWALADYGRTEVEIRDYFQHRCVSGDRYELLEFRDKVMPELSAKIGTANYEDDALRTFSFFAERDYQNGRCSDAGNTIEHSVEQG
ncbi:MAG: hypothetical protein ACK4UN_09960 [Limisphaerales bacterium]